MIFRIIRYELKRRLGHWSSILILLILIFQGIWYTKGAFDYYVNEDMLMNAPAIFYKNLTAGGILMVIIVAIITGGVLYKDIEHKTSQWIYTLPVNEKQFFIGKFLSAYFINVIMGFGYVIGMILVPYAGLAEAHRFGLTPYGQLLHGYVVTLMPTLFLLTSIIFGLIVWFKKMAAGYLGVMVTVILFLVMQIVSEASGFKPIVQLADPFGYVATDALISELTTIEKNTGYLPARGYWLTNLIVWLSIGFIFLIGAYSRFSFKEFVTTKSEKKSTTSIDKEEGSSAYTPITKVVTSFGNKTFLKKLWSLSGLEFKNVVRPPSFRVILGLILFMAIMQNLLWNASYYIGNTVPLTSGMTFFRLSFGVFITILLMVWAGELFFQDRTVKIWQITDSLPVPVWVTTLSRFIAMSGVAFLMGASFMIIGMVSQILMGGAALIDLRLYLYDLLGFNWGWLTYVMWIAFVFFVAGITNSRYLTHILAVGVYFALIMAFELKLAEQVIYGYTGVPGLEDYSEISGYGIWWTSQPWYFFMWSMLTITLVCLGILFWNRGSGEAFRKKVFFTGKQLNWAGKAMALVALITFIGVRAKIIDEVNGKGNFVLSAVEEEEAADYEKKYSYLKKLPHPKYLHVDLVFDFHLEERAASYQAKINLVNRSSKGIDTLFLNLPSFAQIEKLMVTGTDLRLVKSDKKHDMYVYLLSSRLQDEDSLTLTLEATKKYSGFTQSGEDPQPDITGLGAFGSIRDFLPTIGYQEDKELDENRKREDHGLNRFSSRMTAIDNEKALLELAVTPDAEWVTGSIQISTVEDQWPLAPGKLVKTWTENRRAYSHFEIESPTTFNWHLASVSTQPYERNEGQFKYSIWPYIEHPFNLATYEKAAAGAYRYVKNKLGSFPHQEVRFVEIPYYQEKFYAYPNTIAISEKEGWYADTTGLAERAYIHQSMASQMIKLWLQSKIKVANVQGADMLLIALPEALSLHYLKTVHGKEAVDLIIQKKMDLYNKDRYNEPNREPSLLYADGAEYLEVNKGAVELFRLIELMGYDTFFEQMNKWIQYDKGSHVTFQFFYEFLLEGLDSEEQEIMDVAFRGI